MPTDTAAPAMDMTELLAALQGIIDAAEGRSLTEEEVARYETLELELAVARKDTEVRSRQRAYETPIRSDLHVHASGSTAVERSDEERAFETYLRTGDASGMEYRVQTEGTDSAGGFTVPDSFGDRIVARLRAYGGIAGAATTIQTATGSPLPYPTNDDTANTAEIVAEGAAPASAGADLIFGVRTLGAYRYTSSGAGNLPLKVSVELLQDSAFNLEDYLAKALATRIARKQAVDYATGSGTGEPQGLVTGLTVSDEIAGTVPTYGELLAATFAVDEEYLQGGASWVMHSTILAGIQGILDDNGRPLLNTSTDGISGKPSRTLLGYPVIVDNAMPAQWHDGAATPTGSRAVVFGNIKDCYLVRAVKGFTLVTLRELFAVNGLVGFLGWSRSDAIVIDPNAATVLGGANTA